jgi:hypothetical protein
MNQQWRNMLGKGVKEIRFVLCNNTLRGMGMR